MVAVRFFVPVTDHPLGRLKLPARALGEGEVGALLNLALQRLRLAHLCTIAVPDTIPDRPPEQPHRAITAQLPNAYLVRRRKVRRYGSMLGGWETVQPIAVRVELPLRVEVLSGHDASQLPVRMAPAPNGATQEIVLQVDGATEHGWLVGVAHEAQRALQDRAWELLSERLRRQPGWLLQVAQTKRWRVLT